MKINWAKKSFEEIGNIGRGKSRHRPRNDSALYGGKYPFIQTGDIQSADFRITQFTQTYSDFGLAQSKLWPTGTLCISIVGANTAESAILGFDACFPDSVIGFNAYEEESDNYFLKYYLELLKNQLKSISEGAARENLSLEKLLTFKIPWPSTSERRKITRILSAYDDLIENNLKRIKLLEEMAQITYEEWFVRLKFPDHETTPIDSATGLPIGWERSSLLSTGEFLNGYAFKPEDLGENGYPVIKIKEIKNGVDATTPRNDGKDIPDKYIVNQGDILFSWSASLEVVIWPNEPGLLNQHLFKVTPNFGISKPFLYLALKECLPIFDNLTTGATMKHIKRKELDFVKITMPDKSILEQFDKFSDSIFQAIMNLNTQIRFLREARDILLPRLMTGMIDVEQLVLPESLGELTSNLAQESQAA